MAGLAGKYDTAGTARTFHTAGGRDVEITGPYGWKLDVAGEVAALTQPDPGRTWGRGAGQGTGLCCHGCQPQSA